MGGKRKWGEHLSLLSLIYLAHASWFGSTILQDIFSFGLILLYAGAIWDKRFRYLSSRLIPVLLAYGFFIQFSEVWGVAKSLIMNYELRASKMLTGMGNCGNWRIGEAWGG